MINIRGLLSRLPAEADELTFMGCEATWMEQMTDLSDSVMRATAKINRQGRIVIPAECRAAAGFKPGDDLIVETIGEGEIRLSTPRQAIKEAQAIVARYRKKGDNPVQELIDERRAETSRE